MVLSSSIRRLRPAYPIERPSQCSVSDSSDEDNSSPVSVGNSRLSSMSRSSMSVDSHLPADEPIRDVTPRLASSAETDFKSEATAKVSNWTRSSCNRSTIRTDASVGLVSDASRSKRRAKPSNYLDSKSEVTSTVYTTVGSTALENILIQNTARRDHSEIRNRRVASFSEHEDREDDDDEAEEHAAGTADATLRTAMMFALQVPPTRQTPPGTSRRAGSIVTEEFSSRGGSPNVSVTAKGPKPLFPLLETSSPRTSRDVSALGRPRAVSEIKPRLWQSPSPRTPFDARKDERTSSYIDLDDNGTATGNDPSKHFIINTEAFNARGGEEDSITSRSGRRRSIRTRTKWPWRRSVRSFLRPLSKKFTLATDRSQAADSSIPRQSRVGDPETHASLTAGREPLVSATDLSTLISRATAKAEVEDPNEVQHLTCWAVCGCRYLLQLTALVFPVMSVLGVDYHAVASPLPGWLCVHQRNTHGDPSAKFCGYRTRVRELLLDAVPFYCAAITGVTFFALSSRLATTMKKMHVIQFGLILHLIGSGFEGASWDASPWTSTGRIICGISDGWLLFALTSYIFESVIELTALSAVSLSIGALNFGFALQIVIRLIEVQLINKYDSDPLPVTHWIRPIVKIVLVLVALILNWRYLPPDSVVANRRRGETAQAIYLFEWWNGRFDSERLHFYMTLASTKPAPMRQAMQAMCGTRGNRTVVGISIIFSSWLTLATTMALDVLPTVFFTPNGPTSIAGGLGIASCMIVYFALCPMGIISHRCRTTLVLAVVMFFQTVLLFIPACFIRSLNGGADCVGNVENSPARWILVVTLLCFYEVNETLFKPSCHTMLSFGLTLDFSRWELSYRYWIFWGVPLLYRIARVLADHSASSNEALCRLDRLLFPMAAAAMCLAVVGFFFVRDKPIPRPCPDEIDDDE